MTRPGDDLPPPAPSSPRRAEVVPRVRVTSDGAAQPLEAIVRRLIDQHVNGLVLLHGRPGDGKTTALSHLRAVLPADAPVTLVDHGDDLPADASQALAPLVIVAGDSNDARSWLLRLEVCRWEQDDWIEYCLARHKDKCAWILSRLRADERAAELKGSPLLWRIVIDEMAADQALPDAYAALRKHLDATLPPGNRRWMTSILCLRVLRDAREPMLMSELPAGLDDHHVALLHHRAVRVILAADHVVAGLSNGGDAVLFDPLPQELIAAVGEQVRRVPAAMSRLKELLAGKTRRADAMAASLLLAADPFWRPRSARSAGFNHAQLARASWPDLDLRGAHLNAADLHGADLTGARLDSVRAVEANFSRCKLGRASMRSIKAWQANFSSADLAGTSAVEGSFDHADFTRASLRNADFSRADFLGVTLARAQLIGTNLSGATFGQVNVEEAEFIGADLRKATFNSVNLAAAAHFTGCRLRGVIMVKCNLEEMRLPNADFREADLEGSYLTGTFIPHGDFRDANLRDTGLAEIDWENADLRGADLRGSTFHMGSSRSGLVGSPLACEGSRTGFYTDDYDDRDFKPPEEIRKANLCGADLRGANIDGVDFYLVDLRGARYTREQAAHFARCGAILHSRVA